MTWSSSGSAASWPVYTIPGGGVTFRANTDAGVVFVIGYAFNSSGFAQTLNAGNPLPAAFRPLETAIAASTTASGAALQMFPDGSVKVGSSSVQSQFRSFYFTTVTPA